MINTKFWSDTWVVNLDPIEKLLFLYLLTNERTNICGAYELPLKYMAVESGIDKDMVEKILKRFSKDKKIQYVDGWIVIKNFSKHQNSKSPKIQLGIDREMKEIPNEIKVKMDKEIGYVYGMDTQSHSNSNSNLNSNLKGNEDVAGINQVLNSFKEVNPSYQTFFGNRTQRAAAKRLVAVHGLDELVAMVGQLTEINKIPYMTPTTTPYELEKNAGKIKAKLEQQKGQSKIKAVIIK